ncbi:WD40 repeat domain-containing protein [Candidatus Albibeggiatoa sp. nov. BB20]|uniref:WD40 repeat domain-containing protein n=1 Tax=Candidatus Albibeggiatoa sp. nov. BB20 TaxID=3162723 RepID=UPI00336581C0
MEDYKDSFQAEQSIKLLWSQSEVKMLRRGFITVLILGSIVIGLTLFLGIYELYFSKYVSNIFPPVFFIIIPSMMLMSIGGMYYQSKIMSSQYILLNKQGIQSHSGLPIWLQKILPYQDWNSTWENIASIQVKDQHLYETAKISFKTHNTTKSFTTFAFKWIDSQSLNEEHTRYPKEYQWRTRAFTTDELQKMLNRSPLFQYFIQHKISVDVSKKAIQPQLFVKMPFIFIMMIMLGFWIYLTAWDFNDAFTFFLRDKPLAVSTELEQQHSVPNNLLSTWNAHTGNVLSVAVSANGQYAVSGAKDHTVRLWEINTDENIHTFNGHKDAVQAVAFSPSNKLIASGSEDNTIRLWDVETLELDKVLRGLKGHATTYNGIYDLAFSSDGQYLASTNWNGSLVLWDMQTKTAKWVSEGHKKDKRLGHQDSVNAVAFSPDNETLASGGFDNTVRLWNAKTGKQLKILRGHSDWILTVAFSPDGKLLASAGYDKTIRIWSLSNYETLRVIRGHYANVTQVVFTKDNQVLVSSSDDKFVRYWEVSTGANIADLIEHKDFVNSIAFTPDGQKLLSASGDDSIKIWTLGEALDNSSEPLE